MYTFQSDNFNKDQATPSPSDPKIRNTFSFFSIYNSFKLTYFYIFGSSFCYLIILGSLSSVNKTSSSSSSSDSFLFTIQFPVSSFQISSIYKSVPTIFHFSELLLASVRKLDRNLQVYKFASSTAPLDTLLTVGVIGHDAS